MATHTGRLIVTIIFMIFAISALIRGSWFWALAWTLFTIAVGHPFVRDGRIVLDYDDTPREVVTIYEMGPRTPPSAAAPTLPTTMTGAQ